MLGDVSSTCWVILVSADGTISGAAQLAAARCQGIEPIAGTARLADGCLSRSVAGSAARRQGAGADPCVQLTGVSKSFSAISKVLKDISFDVRPGEVHALLGENGAGKSTLIKIISGVLQPDDGELKVEQGSGSLCLAARGAASPVSPRSIRSFCCFPSLRWPRTSIWATHPEPDGAAWIGQKMRAGARRSAGFTRQP